MSAGEEAEPDVGAGAVQLRGEAAHERRVGLVRRPWYSHARKPSRRISGASESHVGGRAVGAQLRRGRAAEHARGRLREVAAPALEHAEHVEVVQRDVDRAVAALGVARRCRDGGGRRASRSGGRRRARRRARSPPSDRRACSPTPCHRSGPCMPAGMTMIIGGMRWRAISTLANTCTWPTFVKTRAVARHAVQEVQHREAAAARGLLRVAGREVDQVAVAAPVAAATRSAPRAQCPCATPAGVVGWAKPRYSCSAGGSRCAPRDADREPRSDQRDDVAPTDRRGRPGLIEPEATYAECAAGKARTAHADPSHVPAVARASPRAPPRRSPRPPRWGRGRRATCRLGDSLAAGSQPDARGARPPDGPGLRRRARPPAAARLPRAAHPSAQLRRRADTITLLDRRREPARTTASPARSCRPSATSRRTPRSSSSPSTSATTTSSSCIDISRPQIDTACIRRGMRHHPAQPAADRAPAEGGRRAAHGRSSGSLDYDQFLALWLDGPARPRGGAAGGPASSAR